MRNWNTVCVVGDAKTHMDNAITTLYNSFYVSFEVNIMTDEICDVGCTHTLDITEKFVKSIFIGKAMGQSCDAIIEEVNMRYHGDSQKAIIVSYKDARKKYQELKRKYHL